MKKKTKVGAAKKSKVTAPAAKVSGKIHRLENYQHPDVFGELLGYEVTAINPKKRTATTELKIRYEHLSPAGRVHGGVISAFFDFACGAALFPLLAPRDFCSTVELKVNYFRPLELKDHLVAETEVVFKGKRLSVIHGFVYRKGEKDPVAMATATYNIVSPQQQVIVPTNQ
ncbi:MAG: PaaI family thioesterase [Bdellovibrionia bacterium]